MKGITPIIKNNSGCDYHRILQPLHYLGVNIDVTKRVSDEETLKNTKILFFNRTPNNDEKKVMYYKHKYGFKLVLDLDDYWELNVGHPLYKQLISEGKTDKEIFKWVKLSDAVTVTTSRLADKVKPFNKNVYVIPNGLPFDEDQYTSFKTESNFMRFIYTGGESHVFDVALLRYAIGKVKTLPHAQFVLSGYQPTNPGVWNKMEGVFKQHPNYERRSFLPLQSYMKTYIDADVCLVPLETNTFTPYKSNIKFLEAGCKNIPVICSNTPPYSDEQDKDKIMYASNTREWVHWIKYCHDNPSYVVNSGLKLGEYVRKHYNLRKINDIRKQLFEYLMS